MNSNHLKNISRRKFVSAAGVVGATVTVAAAQACSPTNSTSLANATSQTSKSNKKNNAKSSSKENNLEKQAINDTKYDYVIIGGGTAGLVMAGRLTEDPTVSVIVLEAGPENTFETGQYAAGAGGMWGPTTNWGYMSAKQAGLNNREIMQARGKVIGGCAAINVGSWSRGTKNNYNSWDLPGWDGATILETYKKIESSQKGNTKYRGTSGPMHLEDTPRGSDMTDVFRKAAIEACVGETKDRNAANPIGFDLWETIFPKGRRWNTENGYLDPARERSNLKVFTDAHVTRINFKGKRAISVSYSKDGKSVVVKAHKEVLLCAGAIGSPQILMLSGVGPAEHLREHGIDVIENLPAIGQNLADHLRTQFGALTPKGKGVAIYADPSDPKQLEEWRKTGYGPLALAENTCSAFVKTKADVPHPDVEFMYAINPPMSMRDDKSRAGWYIMVGLVQPKSKGSVRLASADPMKKAIYDPAYLSDPEDMATYIRGFRIALEHVKTKALSEYTDMSTLQLSINASDDEIAALIKSTAESIYHPVGSVRMGRDDDDTAALDTQCRVKGLQGLRVVDASSIPELVSGHTMAPTILVAERVAQMIKATG
ncbi:GMC family oxidoreductase [Hellea balneolensis]|uniref:GMC family oxidoreductase n=1 Tax=Hellea balneolensis TaxID=287478 RepID=UPI0003FB0B8E|nr:GMC family oxidoreductase N-terminal domain-containing protein [Hellea balneolensis]